MAIWTNGPVIVDASGSVITCDTCPCGTICTTCDQFRDFIEQYSEVEVVLDFNSFGAGFACDPIDGTYLLDYLADPTPIDVGGVLVDQDRVWVYEFPAPVTINPLGFMIVATHVYFISKCDPFPYHAIGYRSTRGDGTNASLQTRWQTTFAFADTPNIVCNNPGTAFDNGSTSLCYAAASADYEFFV